MNLVDQRPSSAPEVDVVVLTALAEERAAVVAAMGEVNCEVIRWSRGDFHVVSMGALRIGVMSLLGMGNVGAAAMASEVIEAWRPRFLALVGIAAGIREHAKDMRLGDVLVADQVVGFELAKVTAEGLQRRYQSFRPHFDLLAAAHAVAPDEWASTIATARPDFADAAKDDRWRRYAAEAAGRFVLAVLRDAPRFTGRTFESQRVPAAAALPPVRCTLPDEQAVFVGRGKELEHIVAAVADTAERGEVIAIHAIDGMPGIGKTTLAVHVAHRLKDQFDRQLFIDLHAHTPGRMPTDPADALSELLAADGVDSRFLPATVDGRASLWRDRMAGQRPLLILDNASDTAQVRPLLPGTPGCLVVVTSRNQLSGLVAAHGARPITMGLFTAGEATELLSRQIGMDRITAEPEAVTEIVAACAGLPLAVAIVAARAALHPHLPLRKFASELRESRARLDMLTTDDTHIGIRAVFFWSYRALTPEAARLFRLLGLHPGPEISGPAAASLAARPAAAVRSLLAELTRSHLLAEPTSGRYAVHDLLRAYAAEQAHNHETAGQRHSATHQMLDHYLHTAHNAARVLEPARAPIPLTPHQPGVIPEQPNSHEQALDWFTAERAVLLAAIEHAAATGFDNHTWQLACLLWTFLEWRGHWHDLVPVRQATAAAIDRLTDTPAQAHARLYLARTQTRLGRYHEAHTQLQHALNLYRQAEDQTGQADAHHVIGEMWARQSDYSQALHHEQQAFVLYRAVGHRFGQAQTLNNIGWFHAQLGNHLQALTYCQNAVTLQQELGNRPGQASAWDSLGTAHHELGHHTQAITCYRNALTLFRDLGNRYCEAETLTHLAAAYHAVGDPEAASEASNLATSIVEQIDHPATEIRHKLAILHPRSNQG